MAGKDEIANAVLGGASDYMCDIFAKIMQWYYAKDDQKVLGVFAYVLCTQQLTHYTFK